MLCASPVELSEGFSVPCGNCPNCRINRKRFWTGRMIAEASYCPASSFWGLTYAPETVPIVQSGPFAGAMTLDPRDLTNFIKRWRRLKPKDESFRYFAVGEYGDEGHRPHYHLVAFGPRLDVALEDRIRRAWSYVDAQGTRRVIGRVSVSEFRPERAAYCAGYTIKKLTKPNDYRLLDGQHPEFFRVSRQPPLGHRLMEDIGRSCYTRSGSYLLAETGDVPHEFRIEKKRYPIGRYWIEKLREMLDVEKPQAKTNAERYPDYPERLARAKAQAAKARRQSRASGQLETPFEVATRSGVDVSGVRTGLAGYDPKEQKP